MTFRGTRSMRGMAMTLMPKVKVNQADGYRSCFVVPKPRFLYSVGL